MNPGTKIHPTAIINVDNLELGNDVEIGPYCVLEGESIKIGDRSKIYSHTCISGITTIESDVSIFHHAIIGNIPQDLKYAGEKSSVHIGKNTSIREHVTIHRGTAGGGMQTKIGDNCLIMASSHVAHDCIIGNNVIISHNVVLGGHVKVGEYANIGGLSAVHQKVVIGKYALVGGGSAVVHNVIPYGNAYGERASLMGINVIGLKRKGYDNKAIIQLIDAYKAVFEEDGGLSISERAQKWLKNNKPNYIVDDFIKFLSKSESRSICIPKNKGYNDS